MKMAIKKTVNMANIQINNSSIDTETTQMQKVFAAHLRSPHLSPAPPNIEDRRLQIYRDLVYNNIENFIHNGFPVLRKLYSDKNWHAMVHDFVYRHCSVSPYFLELGNEFLAYLQNERESEPFDPPFLFELARYERAELALFVASEELPIGKQLSDDKLLTAIPSMSPLAWLMVFDFPVHKIGSEFNPTQASPTPVCLVVYRNRNDQVKFLEANTVTARLLELCEANTSLNGEALLLQIAAELNHPQPSVVLKGGREILAQLQSLDIILY